MRPALQRTVGVTVLLAVGFLALPTTAFILDRPRTENLILPAHLALVALVGVALCLALPALCRPGAEPVRRALTGAGWGLLAGIAGLLVFFLLLNGFDGA